MKKKKDSNVLLYALIAAAAIVAVFSVYTMLSTNYGLQYQKAMSAQNPANVCATPQGYTNEAWQQHMSHHPDRYAECFK